MTWASTFLTFKCLIWMVQVHPYGKQTLWRKYLFVEDIWKTKKIEPAFSLIMKKRDAFLTNLMFFHKFSAWQKNLC